MKAVVFTPRATASLWHGIVHHRHAFAFLFAFVVAALGIPHAVAAPFELSLPPRPPDALGGRAFAAQLIPLDLAARESAILAEVRRGNVPPFWRRFVEVPLGAATISVAPDYLAVGDDDDYFFTPLSPAAAQLLADELGCVLPTKKIVDAIHRAAPLKLEPSPIPPSAAMTTAAVFAAHNATVRLQRASTLSLHPLGTLVAGDKKDLVLTPLLHDAPGKVAIYGLHRPDGNAIQPLYLGHAISWVDYSHGVRLVARAATLNGQPTTVDALLVNPKTSSLLSNEGPLRDYSFATVRSAIIDLPGEKSEELRFDAGVRAIINAPVVLDPAKPTRLVLFALPAGNTIEQAIGLRLAPDDDERFNLQHIGAQTRWLRAHAPDANLVVAYLQCAERSFVLWRRAHPDNPARIAIIVDALRTRFPGAKLTLASHSAGGTFMFGLIDGLEKIPADIERLAFLDSNYAYDVDKSHAAKLAAWLAASPTHHLCVLAYQDYRGLLNGKTFVSESGGTWGRSLAMLRDLGAKFPFTRSDAAGLQTHVALDGQVKFFLKENPDKKILHTRQVEWNGFIHALLAGTPLESRDYAYLGPRVYEDLIAPP